MLNRGVCLVCREKAAGRPLTQQIREQQDRDGVFAAWLTPHPEADRG